MPASIVQTEQRMSRMVLEGSERELVEACQRGERDAFRALFESYKGKVYSVALRFAGEEATAMDIAQDTFLKLFSRLRDFRGDATFETRRAVLDGTELRSREGHPS